MDHKNCNESKGMHKKQRHKRKCSLKIYFWIGDNGKSLFHKVLVLSLNIIFIKQNPIMKISHKTILKSMSIRTTRSLVL